MRRCLSIVDKRSHVAVVARLHLKRDCHLVVAPSQRKADAHDLSPLGIDFSDIHQRPSAICLYEARLS